MNRVFVALLAFVLVNDVLAVPAQAAPGYGNGSVEITTSFWDYTHPDTNPVTASQEFPALFLQKLADAYNANKQPFCDKLKARLTTANAMGKGFTAHPDNFVCNPGSLPLTLLTDLQGGVYSLNFIVTGHYLELTTTQPALGRSFDPRFSVRFDTAVSLAVQLPSQTQALSVKSAIVKATNVHLDTHNAAGDVALAAVVTALIIWYQNAFPTLVEQALDSLKFDMTKDANAALGTLGLSALSTKGFVDLTPSLITTKSGITLKLVANKPVSVPTKGSAAMPLTIEWAAGSGAPSLGCAAFSASAAVQVGPPSAGSPMQQAGVAASGSGSPKQVPGWQRCTINVTSLPAGLPVKFSATFSGRWNTDKYVPNAHPAPYGYTSGVAVLPSTQSVVFQLGVHPTTLYKAGT